VGTCARPYNLPWNRGTPIEIQIAFYDGGDPGAVDSNGVLTAANKAQFKEAADDFIYEENGLTYYLYYDMNVSKPEELWAKTLTSLDMRGYKVTDIMFYDHSTTDSNNDFALEFGGQVWGPVKLQSVARWLNFRYPKALPEDCTLHFRHCDVAAEENRELFKNLISLP
jgi:hypothetical protein